MNLITFNYLHCKLNCTVTHLIVHCPICFISPFKATNYRTWQVKSIYQYIHMCVYVNKPRYVHEYVYACKHVNMYTCMCSYVYIHIHMHTCIYTHVRTHILSWLPYIVDLIE